MAIGISYTIKTNPDLSRIAAAYRPTRAKMIDTQLDSLSRVMHRNIVDEAPERTGQLKKAIRRKRRKQFLYEILVDRRMKGGKYEPYVRLGTKPHLILPKRPKYALWWPGLDHPVAYANHPGTKPNPYWDRGLMKSAKDIRRAQEVIGHKIVDSLIIK